MGDAQASVVEAAQSVVMLAAVGDDAFDREALKRLRAAADLLVSLLLMADPGAKPATVDWELFLSRLGHKEPRPADAPSSAGDLRAAIREFLQASTHKYFTPQLVFEALRDAADFDHTGYPDFRKAVQNAISAMAKSNNPTKLRKVSRGNYIVPGREACRTRTMIYSASHSTPPKAPAVTKPPVPAVPHPAGRLPPWRMPMTGSPDPPSERIEQPPPEHVNGRPCAMRSESPRSRAAVPNGEPSSASFTPHITPEGCSYSRILETIADLREVTAWLFLTAKVIREAIAWISGRPPGRRCASRRSRAEEALLTARFGGAASARSALSRLAGRPSRSRGPRCGRRRTGRQAGAQWRSRT
ncbi:hypothetical protein [Streptomyces noursei]|uniref:hypothetical protein n=1 Tax=Streptomyces noursei TaxID=1971 RepID=UPI0038241286